MIQQRHGPLLRAGQRLLQLSVRQHLPAGLHCNEYLRDYPSIDGRVVEFALHLAELVDQRFLSLGLFAGAAHVDPRQPAGLVNALDDALRLGVDLDLCGPDLEQFALDGDQLGLRNSLLVLLAQIRQHLNR